MNYGGKPENEREKANETISGRRGADEFGRAISRIAVSQVCENVGFQSCSESAIDALADIAVRYLRDIGKVAIFYANLAGRTECNVFDIIQGLEDLGFSRGFPGASEISHCMTSSGAVRDIVDFVESADEIPFAQPVPHFPIIRNRRLTPSFVEMGETPPFKHVPVWLPAFPDPHTYIHSPMWNERVTNPHADKIELAKQRRKAERSLLNLQQRLLNNGSAVPSTLPEVDDDKERLQVEDRKNPFFAEPFQAGEKDVSPVAIPAKILDEANGGNHISLLETFSPAIEAVRDGFSDPGGRGNNILPLKRSVVHLKFKTGKKILGESLDLNLRNKNSGRTASSLGRDDEKDDKKRRAELILRQSMENPLELSQL